MELKQLWNVVLRRWWLILLPTGVALAFLTEYLDPTLRSRSEVEALGLPVIAEIPRH